jgi:DNA polymerase elongation subunit (family B)
MEHYLIQSVAREQKSNIKKERAKERVVLKRRQLAFEVYANSVYWLLCDAQL